MDEGGELVQSPPQGADKNQVISSDGDSGTTSQHERGPSTEGGTVYTCLKQHQGLSGATAASSSKTSQISSERENSPGEMSCSLDSYLLL